ncbi:hypothetical protein SAMN02799631_00386 [Methylobacterium sp. 174MFSha1.1]|uniref:hypothetical protein n=1 Tax=Methylobacterium sp. 174MFSha1.1 TaxID=1502749 RepID=UPI0008F1C555|nr:hypothetical protein [Methylobacterium sp. 174MFSha1.1]SFU38843.1 hypothetical protein SAMN02799631_00386 [Methylobacterium sp. 174MFSha1.1]
MKIAVVRRLQLIDALADDDPSALILPMEQGEAVMGETVAAYLARVAWRFDLPTICRINGECYGRAEWETYHLAVNDNVEFISRPMGGNSGGGSSGKSILAIVAMIALTAVAGPAGPLGAALATALGTVGGAIAGALPIGAPSLSLSLLSTWTQRP